MTIASSLYRSSWMIREALGWIDADIAAGGYASPDGQSALDLAATENRLRELADEIAERRAKLVREAA